MTLQLKVTWAVLGSAAILIAFVLLSEKVEEHVLPQPKRALIAIETEGSGLARTGHVEIERGAPFTLHAVVEAVDWAGKTLYYTDAKRLEVDGDEVATDLIRRWDRSPEPRVLWFTVEGYKPYLDLSSGGDLSEFQYREFLRPNWPRSWSIPGSLQGSGDSKLRQALLGDVSRFGTQHYHVRVEFFGPKSQIKPQRRIQSLEAASLPGSAKEYPTVVAAMSGRMKIPTSLFGVTQIELGRTPSPEQAKALSAWTDAGLAFTRKTVLRSMLDQEGLAYQDLDWVDIDMAEGVEWTSLGAEAGDLLRVGERWVLLFEDVGKPRILDREDLCLDFDKGPRVRKIGEIFIGDGLIEWASMAGDSNDDLNDGLGE